MAADRPEATRRVRVPRDPSDDHSEDLAERRRRFVEEQTGTSLHHVGRFSFDPQLTKGNIENFTGVAQVPIGITGPLLIHGEDAQGEFYVPLATTEGTLVASYNRGMRLLTESGGVRTTVVEDFMQRAPAFVFHDARAARDFGRWVDEHFDEIKAAAESTTSVGALQHLRHYQIGAVRHVRFNYTTGDAAGQNMTSKATLAACEWISANHPGGARFALSGNMDTDKKHSHLNTLQSRGKRVVAEAIIPNDVLEQLTGATTRQLFRGRQLATDGAFLAGSANNGAHYANALAALFIATGQDVANVAESHAGVTSSHLLSNGDYYWSVTLTSLIVATYGGGTGLATQRECLEVLGCYGKGKARKFAEICAAVVLAGEASLIGAAIAGDWVSSHDRYGRNRP